MELEEEQAFDQQAIQRLRNALELARACILQLSGGRGHDSEQVLKAIAEALDG